MEYLHIESAVMALFVAHMIWTHLRRATDSSHYTQRGKAQAVALTALFVILCGGFGVGLLRVSPLLALELAVGFTLSLLHPANALCLYVHLFYLRPWELAPENPVLMALPRILSVLWLLSWLIHPSRHAKPGKGAYRSLSLLLGFSAWLFLTTFFLPDMAELQSTWFNSYFKGMLVFVMCIYTLESPRSVSQFENTILFSSLGLMAMGLYRYLTVGGEGGRLGLVGMLADPNDLATIVIMALPFALMKIFTRFPQLVDQAFGALFAVMAAMVIWFTRSRGAIVALVAQMGVVYYSRVTKEKRIQAILLACVIAVAGAMVVQVIPREAEDLSASQTSRLIYWKAAIKMAIRHPLMGVGYNQFPVNYDSYSGDDKFEWGRRTCHSSWFLALSETGFVGAWIYFTFFGCALGFAWKNRKQRPGQFYALVGYAAGMSFLSHTYLTYPYLLTGLILSQQSLTEKSA